MCVSCELDVVCYMICEVCMLYFVYLKKKKKKNSTHMCITVVWELGVKMLLALRAHFL